MSDILEARIRDRLDIKWLTPSQQTVWEAIQHFDGLPHRVINIYGPEGTGKTFMGWFLERMNHSTYRLWPNMQKPLLPRLTLDDALSDRATPRDVRPLLGIYGSEPISFLFRSRVEERSMQTFESSVIGDGRECCRTTLSRHSQIILCE